LASESTKERLDEAVALGADAKKAAGQAKDSARPSW
jgi:hypothetical protein